MQVELLLGPLTDERTAVLINLARKITDFSMEDEHKMEMVIFVPFYFRSICHVHWIQ